VNIATNRLRTAVGKQRYLRPRINANPVLLNLLGNILRLPELPLAEREMSLVCIMIRADPLATVSAAVIKPCVIIQNTF
jgi:hypothetical protein